MDEAVKESVGKEDAVSEEAMRNRVIQLAFNGDPKRLEEFCEVLERELPAGTCAVLRGSAVTGERYDDGAPFDADGPGTSDLDLTLIGDHVHAMFILDGYYLPKIHSKPLSDKDPDIAPDLVPLRQKLIKMVSRPVNIQATRDFVMYVRENLFGQPYLTLIKKPPEEAER